MFTVVFGVGMKIMQFVCFQRLFHIPIYVAAYLPHPDCELFLNFDTLKGRDNVTLYAETFVF